MSLDSLKPLAEVSIPDERWKFFSTILETHHALIAGIQLNPSVPEEVGQHFENARNVWLYAYFSYSLLTVALATVHVACESAIKTRARQEGLPGWEKKKLYELLEVAIANRWLVDAEFVAAEHRETRWKEQRALLLAIGAEDVGPYVEPSDDQDHTRRVLSAVRTLRNALMHGELLLTPNVAPVFRAAADLINQLFPAEPPRHTESFDSTHE